MPLDDPPDDFTRPRDTESREDDRPPGLIARERAERDIRAGSVWLVSGLLVTVISSAMAGAGGSHVFAWGAILLGGAQLSRGLLARSSLDDEVMDPGASEADASEDDAFEADALENDPFAAGTPEMRAGFMSGLPPAIGDEEESHETWGVPAWLLWTLVVGAILLVLLVFYQIGTGSLPF